MAKDSPLVDKKALGCPRFVLVIKVILSRTAPVLTDLLRPHYEIERIELLTLEAMENRRPSGKAESGSVPYPNNGFRSRL